MSFTDLSHTLWKSIQIPFLPCSFFFLEFISLYLKIFCFLFLFSLPFGHCFSLLVRLVTSALTQAMYFSTLPAFFGWCMLPKIGPKSPGSLKDSILGIWSLWSSFWIIARDKYRLTLIPGEIAFYWRPQAGDDLGSKGILFKACLQSGLWALPIPQA